MKVPPNLNDIWLRNQEIIERTRCECEQARALREQAADLRQMANEILEYQYEALLRRV